MRGMPFERQSRGRGENLTAELSASRKDMYHHHFYHDNHINTLHPYVD